MAQCSITLTVRVAWWVRPYIQSVAIFAFLTGMTPDPKKIAKTVMRGVTVRT